ncbi:MAG: type II toxin-antitoxin system RelB/DinJ family antitoxin [Candidatus Synoicihabitans palmerolidicus]|nr:type II toxin-antitoxin system RelB/DinJ family antitoxin [Candidatus Synoicihabitans palmerolidicus]
MPTVQLRTRVDSDLKRKSDSILNGLGLDTGTYVAMALAQLVNRRGLPFAVTESDEDYFANEYGLSAEQMVAAGKRMQAEANREKAAGRLRTINGPDDL